MDSAKRYFVELVLFIVGSSGVRQQCEGKSETESCGTGTGYWGQQEDEKAVRGTERNGYFVGLVLFIVGSRGVIQQ